MPFTNEEAKSIEFMVESYKQSKETFVFSEENDVLWNKLLNKVLEKIKWTFRTNLVRMRSTEHVEENV